MASCIPSFDDARRRPSSACNAIDGCFDWLARLLRLLAVSFDGETRLQRPLVVLDEVPRAGWWGRTTDGIGLWFDGLFGGD